LALNHEVYKNAPIKEAALDIRVRSLVDLDPEALETAKDPNYPELFLKPTKVEVRVEANNLTLAASAAADNTLLGYGFRSADQKQIYQVRTDGFTHNRLAPYQEWDVFAAEARRLWNVYRNALHPEVVELAGLNYVNEIPIPFGVDFSEYVKTYIEVPAGLPQSLNTFNFGYQLTIPDDGGFLFISQGYGPLKTDGFVNMILNIQAFKQLHLPATDPSTEEILWSTFEGLRKAKSDAFEACITDKVREMIR
jgi:uncharacterized protein (TIGR04255 family)